MSDSSRSYAKDDLVRVPHGEYDEWPGRVGMSCPQVSAKRWQNQMGGYIVRQWQEAK